MRGTNNVSISNHQPYIYIRCNAKRCIGQRNRGNALFPRGIPGINSSLSSVFEKKKERKKGRKEREKKKEDDPEQRDPPRIYRGASRDRNIASITFFPPVVIYVDKRKIPSAISRPIHFVYIPSFGSLRKSVSSIRLPNKLPTRRLIVPLLPLPLLLLP